MKKILLQKAVEEIEIGDKVFILDTSDDTLKKWQKEIHALQDELNALDYTDNDALEKVRVVMIACLDLILGENAGNNIYEMTGRSTSLMMNVVFELAKIMTDKIKNMKSNAAADYIEPNLRSV